MITKRKGSSWGLGLGAQGGVGGDRSEFLGRKWRLELKSGSQREWAQWQGQERAWGLQGAEVCI